MQAIIHIAQGLGYVTEAKSLGQGGGMGRGSAVPAALAALLGGALAGWLGAERDATLALALLMVAAVIVATMRPRWW